MAHTPAELVVVTDETFMHMRITCIYHRHYPEIRGEGRSVGEASGQLARRLACSLERAHGSGRAQIERALAEVRAIRSSRSRHRHGALAAVP